MDNVTDDDATAMLPTLQISAADRLRVFREDDAALAELADITHKRAIADGEHANAAGHLDLRIRERRAAMWGYDSPIRYDMVQVEVGRQPTRYEQITAALMRLKYGLDWQSSDGNGAVGTLPDGNGPDAPPDDPAKPT